MRLAGLLVAGLIAAMAASPASGKLQPVFARSVLVKPAGGVVTVTPKGVRKSRRLRRPTLLKLGSTVDTTRGKVRLFAAVNRAGDLEHGVFSEGGFVVTQEANGQTDLTLTGRIIGTCPGAAAGTVHGARVPRRRLFGNAHGHFRTVGRNSSATVRGTTWLTEDRCDGTHIDAKQGQVEVGSAAFSFPLMGGDSITFFCNDVTLGEGPGAYCVVLLLRPQAGRFGGGLLVGTGTPETQYDLCVTDPQGRETCTTYNLSEPSPEGFKTSAVVCGATSGPGTYTLRWRLGGKVLFPPESGFVGALPAPFDCVHQP